MWFGPNGASYCFNYLRGSKSISTFLREKEMLYRAFKLQFFPPESEFGRSFEYYYKIKSFKLIWLVKNAVET